MGTKGPIIWTLQDRITPSDRDWSYNVPSLPKPAVANSQKLLKSLSVISNDSKQCIILRLSKTVSNRALAHDNLDRFISISFADFRLYYPPKSQNESIPLRAPPKETSDYIVRLLRFGIILNGVHYNFYGHSNSQLKSKTCFLYASTKEKISEIIEGLGDFTKNKTVAKKAKRIGLLFSTGEAAINLKPDLCEDIPDVVSKDYVFTDGCGLISHHLASLLVKQAKIRYRNKAYFPSVFQIRYRGYKGVLTLEPTLKGKVLVQFRDSMKKFKEGNDLSFSVVEFSKPYTFGYLNDEIILLLHSLGISESILLQKQKEHLDSLALASSDPRYAFRFLTYCNRLDLAERVLLDGLESITASVGSLVSQEYEKMTNKRDEQRCRIMLSKSRLLFGVCDPKAVLKEGECAVRVTLDADGQARQLAGMEILVTRNPCLHPGDLQKFKAVESPELVHLIDCIVFPTRGKRPSADLMSGGDLDGDTFFVCWDSDIIPRTISEPAYYTGPKEPVSFKPITDDDRLVYFVRYTNASLGRTKNLYLDWARLKGPISSECQELNHLFSKCVDGHHIKIPEHLVNPPPPSSENNSKFILDILHAHAKDTIQSRRRRTQHLTHCSYDIIQLLLSRDDVALSEFELVQITHRWCLKNNVQLSTFLDFFDINNLGDDERTWIVAQLPPTAAMSSSILNGLTQSSLLDVSELYPFKLHYPGLRWKRIFDSTQDRMARFMHITAQSLELFHKKLIVIRVDSRLTIAIYIPNKLEKRQDCQVDDTVRLFAFPHTQGSELFQRRVVPTKKNYRLYCDDHSLQLFEGQRRSTWIFLTRPGSSDTTYGTEENEGKRRRQRQATVDSGENFDCAASIDLGRFSQNLSRHIGRVNRSGILGAEIYVISNRDVRSLRVLDLWLEQIDTEKVVPLFEREAREYTVPKLSKTDWTTVPENVRKIARDEDFVQYETFETAELVIETMEWLLERDEKGLLLGAYDYLLNMVKVGSGLISSSVLLRRLIAFTRKAPFLSIAFIGIGDWKLLRPELTSVLSASGTNLLQSIVLATNVMQGLAIEPFQKVLAQLPQLSLEALGSLCETMTLTVRTTELALDLLLGSLEHESSRLLVGRPRVNDHYLRNFSGIVIDHVEEASQSQKPLEQLLNLKKTAEYGNVKSTLRIDIPLSNVLKLGDHVRLTTANSASNKLVNSSYSIDALVKSSKPGVVTFDCLHPLPPYVEDCSWQVQHCGSFVTCKTMIDALNLYQSELAEGGHVHQQLLGLVDSTSSVPMDSVDYTSRNNLNESQNKAVRTALASPLTCWWGPPGTGKTHTVVVLLQELITDQTKRVLVTAPTHNAVDNILSKYIDGRNSTTQEKWIEPIRVTTDIRKVAEKVRSYTCDAMMDKDLNEHPEARKKAQARISHSRLIFTTCIGASLGLLRNETFDTVIIDEASQQTEPASLVPLVKGCCTKAILVGDHLQLRATVTQHAAIQGFDVSLFERLYTDNQNRIQKIMLDSQYRMHREICSFSSEEFYEGKLHTAIPDGARPLAPSNFPWPISPTNPNAHSRMVFIPCSSSEDLGRKSKSNKGQATLCVEICKRLMAEPTKQTITPPLSSSSTTTTTTTTTSNKNYTTPSIAILTPYTAQVDLLKILLPSTNSNSTSISSIDGFQGREADIVIFCTVRCNVGHEIGFLKDLRRLNVVMTRARSGCIVVGDRATLTMGETGAEGDGEEEYRRVWKRLVGRLVEVRVEC